MPQPRLRNRIITLPSNVPKLYDDSIKFELPRDLLWNEYPCPMGYDPVISSMRYGELWIAEVKRRWPETNVIFKAGPDYSAQASYMKVGLNHPQYDALMKDGMRLADDLRRKPQMWLLKPNSKHWRRLRKKLKPQENQTQEFLGRTF
jgi:hypothetical protein